MLRWKLTPHAWSLPAAKRIVRNGIANSAVHPMSVMAVRTSHAPSQLRLKPAPAPACCDWPPPRPPPPCPSLVTWPSYSRPAGLVPNTKPFSRSRYVSKIIWKLSVSSSGVSRRESETTIDFGSRSCRTTPTYSVVSVNATRRSVRSDAGRPSSGCTCQNSDTAGTDAHTGSPWTSPSMTGGVLMRTASRRGAPAGGAWAASGAPRPATPPTINASAANACGAGNRPMFMNGRVIPAAASPSSPAPR